MATEVQPQGVQHPCQCRGHHCKPSVTEAESLQHAETSEAARCQLQLAMNPEDDLLEARGATEWGRRNMQDLAARGLILDQDAEDQLR